jgi:O-antigen/teichoic acid export membrane protein
MGIEGILIAGVISSAVTGIFLVVYMLRRIRLTFSFGLLKSMLGYSFPLVWSWAGMYVLHFGDRFLLQRLATLSAVGIYALAYKFGIMANTLILTPFNLTWAPKRFEVVKEADAPRTFSHIFTYISLVQIWAGLGVAVLIKDALKVMSEPEYHSAFLYVPVLIAGYFFYGTYSFIQFGVLLKKKTKYLGGLSLLMAAVNIGLNLLLIPPLGVWGATLATFISYAMLAALIYPISQRLYYIPYQFGRLFKLFGTAVVLYFAAYFVNPSSLTLSIIIKFLIGFSFPLVLYFERFYTPTEITKIRLALSELRQRIFQKRETSHPQGKETRVEEQ